MHRNEMELHWIHRRGHVSNMLRQRDGCWQWSLPCEKVGNLADSKDSNSEISAYSAESGKAANQDVDSPKQGKFSGL